MSNSTSVSSDVIDILYDENSISEMKGKHLTFWTDKQLFAVSIADVVQIVGVQDVTVVPEFPYYAKGVINLRGSIIPIIDARLRLGKPEIEYTERTCIIVTSICDKLMGFVVDAVESVIDISDTQISPPPHVSGERESPYLTGVAILEIGVVLLINTKMLLGENVFELLSCANA